ncbi:MAG: hypothetical protein JW987_10355 [Anaerolineaceae bacterium]|nr:hypothetical protein [Anaerolineaceae bacterium]
MAKSAGKIRAAELYTNLERLSRAKSHSENSDDEPLDLSALANQPIRLALDSSKTLRMKKFRAQLFYQWLAQTFEPCRAADIGGGKGLISYLLLNSGWDPVVIDPFDQPLPDKYKDITSERRVKIPPGDRVARITAEFEVEHAEGFDLLIGMHAHGCNAKIIDAAAKYGCGFVLFPCCVIDEPFYPRLGVHWLESLADYALFKKQDFFPFRLNFKGQNIGLCHVGKCRVKESSTTG